MEWLLQNKEWIFGGLGISIPIAVITWLFFSGASSRVQKQKSGSGSTNIQVGRDLTVKRRSKDE